MVSLGEMNVHSGERWGQGAGPLAMMLVGAICAVAIMVNLPQPQPDPEPEPVLEVLVTEPAMDTIVINGVPFRCLVE